MNSDWPFVRPLLEFDAPPSTTLFGMFSAMFVGAEYAPVADRKQSVETCRFIEKTALKHVNRNNCILCNDFVTSSQTSELFVLLLRRSHLKHLPEYFFVTHQSTCSRHSNKVTIC
jgi:hypothetical protein